MSEANLRIARRVIDEPYGWTASYRATIDPARLALELRVQLQPGLSVTAADLAQVRQETVSAVARYYDQRFAVQEEGSGQQRPVHVNVAFVTSDPDLKVTVHTGSGRDNLQHWFLDSGVTARAHELGHAFGLKDEYVDPLVRDRADACSAGVYRDHSLMGDFHQEGVARAELKARHAAAIIRDLNVTLGRAFKAAVVADDAGLQAGNPPSAEPGRVPAARAGGPVVFSIQALREQARASAGHDFPEQDHSRRLRT